MGRQYFQDGPYIDAQVATPSALVSTSAEALWIGAQYTPIFANDPKAGKIYTIKAGGILSTSTSGTLIIAPQYGVLGGTTLGTSATLTPTFSLSNVPWKLEFDLVFRTIGASGTNSTCIGTGMFSFGGTTASGQVLALGGTSASVDATINSAITFSKTLSVAGSVSTQYAYIFSRN
jgi:hypothetical protein